MLKFKSLNVGDKVVCYYDDKSSRGVAGKVVKVRGFLVVVEFIPYGGHYTGELKFITLTKRRDGRYTGYLKDELDPYLDFYCVYPSPRDEWRAACETVENMQDV